MSRAYRKRRKIYSTNDIKNIGYHVIKVDHSLIIIPKLIWSESWTDISQRAHMTKSHLKCPVSLIFIELHIKTQRNINSNMQESSVSKTKIPSFMEDIEKR